MDNSGSRGSAASVRRVLDAHGLKLTKSMGQNFLVDANITSKIVRGSGVDKSCGVLEVGPGLGALTQELCHAAGHVTAVELDKRLVPILGDMFIEQENVCIVQGDILKLDVCRLVDDTMCGLRAHVCANLPYNITTPAITSFIESGAFESITVMVQKEVALRICAKPGSPEYGSFTVFANYHAKPEILFDVPPECFTPRPKVMSSVVKMNVREKHLLDAKSEKVFFTVVRAAFGQRRKTLVNALHAVYGERLRKSEILAIALDCGFEAHVRGEVLGVDEFMRLANMFVTICN